MGALFAAAKNVLKQGLKDKARGKKSRAACCVSGCGTGCLGVIVLIVLLVMGIVGALQSVYDTMVSFWDSITNGIYMDYVADDEDRYLDAYYSVAELEELTAYQYNFLFTDDYAQEVHADLLDEIEGYFKDSNMSYNAFKDFVSIVSEFEDYSPYSYCLRYIPVVTRQYAPSEFADILESFLSEEAYPYFETGSMTDAVIPNLYIYEQNEPEMFEGYREDIEILRTSSDEDEIKEALSDVYTFFENLPTDGQETVTTHRILYGYLATVEDDYNWEFSSTRYSNQLDELYNVKRTPDTELLEYKDGAIVYSLSAGKMEDSAWLSPSSYEYEYGISWQHVYATYVCWAYESGVLSDPDPEEAEEKEASGNIITYIDHDKLYQIASTLMDSNHIEWYTNNSIEDINGYFKNSSHALVSDFYQRKEICILDSMMADLPKKINYVKGDVLQDGGARVSTSVTAVPLRVKSLLGTVEYCGTQESVLDGVNVYLTPEDFAQENAYLICGDRDSEKFDWDFYSQILCGAPKGEQLAENLDKLIQIVENEEELDFFVPFEHDGYPYTIALASVQLNPGGIYSAGSYVPVDGEDALSIWNFFRKKGLTEVATSGVLGNLYQESHFVANNMENRFEGPYNDETYTAAVDSGTYTNFVHDKIGYGIAQFTWWTLKQELLEYAKLCGTSISDLEMQLNFLWITMNDPKYGNQNLVATLNACRTPEEAAVTFEALYEKAGSSAQNNNRIAYANSIYDQFVGSGGVINAEGRVPIIQSPYSACQTGVLGSAGTCITLNDTQINMILESVGNISASRRAILRSALEKVGRIPYVLGGGHSDYWGEPSVMDCSGFVGYILYHSVGIDLRGGACSEIVNGFRYGSISGGYICGAEQIEPGDLIIRLTPSGNHAVIYVGVNAYGNIMVVDETGHSYYDGNVFYQQKGTSYLTDGYSVFIHLNL